MIFPTLDSSTLKFSRQQNIFRRAAFFSEQHISLAFTLHLSKEMDASRFFGPRKARCVDFSKQTYSERYDFFDRSRSGGALGGCDLILMDLYLPWMATRLRLQELDK